MFVFINAAMSADGKIATFERKKVRISGEEDLDRVDELRANSDVIVVGIGTVFADNPSLCVKSMKRREERVKGGKEENPIRVVVDSKAKTPLDSDLLTKGSGRRIIVVSKGAPADRIALLRSRAEIIIAGKDEVDLKTMLNRLEEMDVKRIMVEGGATLNWSFVSQNLVDEIYAFIAPTIIGGANAPSLVDGDGFKANKSVNLRLIDLQRVDEGVLLKWRVITNPWTQKFKND